MGRRRPERHPAADGSLQLARAAGPGPALPAIPPRYRSACQSGFEDSSFPHPLVCHAGLPVLDLNRNGVDDYKEPGRFRSQGYTDFNGDGTADATEPGAFTYGNPLYRPGQPGVRCLRDPDIAGRLDCGPYLDLLIKLSADQTPQITKSAGSFLAGLLPITDALQASRDASHGNILGGLLHAALALPPLKAAREGVRGVKAGLHALGIGGRAAGKALRGTRLVAGGLDAAKAARLARRLRALKRQRAAARAAGDSKRARELTRQARSVRIRHNSTLGRIAERKAGITGPKRKVQIPGPGRRSRVPDDIVRERQEVVEVKGGPGLLRYTQQLKDELAYARSQGKDWKLVLVTDKPRAQLDDDLRAAIDTGKIVLRTTRQHRRL